MKGFNETCMNAMQANTTPPSYLWIP